MGSGYNKRERHDIHTDTDILDFASWGDYVE